MSLRFPRGAGRERGWTVGLPTGHVILTWDFFLAHFLELYPRNSEAPRGEAKLGERAVGEVRRIRMRRNGGFRPNTVPLPVQALLTV